MLKGFVYGNNAPRIRARSDVFIRGCLNKLIEYSRKIRLQTSCIYSVVRMIYRGVYSGKKFFKNDKNVLAGHNNLEINFEFGNTDT